MPGPSVHPAAATGGAALRRGASLSSANAPRVDEPTGPTGQCRCCWPSHSHARRQLQIAARGANDDEAHAAVGLQVAGAHNAAVESLVQVAGARARQAYTNGLGDIRLAQSHAPAAAAAPSAAEDTARRRYALQARMPHTQPIQIQISKWHQQRVSPAPGK